MKRLSAVMGAVLMLTTVALAVEAQIPAGSKVFVAPMDGFETYMTAALAAKHVPLVVVADRDKADFEIRGGSQSEKPGWARTILTGQSRTDEQASIQVVNLKTSAVVFAYAVNKTNAVHGKQSAAESCAKHLKNAVGKVAR